MAPSFWAAEVEELPRGAGVEWAALQGVVGAGVKACSFTLPSHVVRTHTNIL
jgi:diphthine-ammonia ligase